MLTEIRLSFNRKEIEEIYFVNNNWRILFGPTTKRQSFYLVAGLVGLPFLFIHFFQNQEQLLMFCAVGLLAAFAYDFYKVAKPIYDWKKSVVQFINEAENFQLVKIEYNDTYLNHIQDKHEHKQTWDKFDSAVITDRYIWLFSTSNILLPKALMQEQEYVLLTQMIREKVKDVRIDL